MLPYFEIPPLHVGPITIAPFGILVAVGVSIAARRLVIEAERDGLDTKILSEYPIWALIAGVAMGHWVHLFLYHPEELSKGPLQVFKFWDGLSSFGGLLGGILAALIFFRLRKAKFSNYGDAFALAVAPGWAIARVGCFVAHDHPGTRSDFFLALHFPDGPRHDLGLYDALLLSAITVLLIALRRRKILAGKLLPLLALLYAIGRFCFDFLRATDLAYVDARYAGLTPAQYACMPLIAYGLIGLAGSKRSDRQGGGLA